MDIGHSWIGVPTTMMDSDGFGSNFKHFPICIILLRFFVLSSFIINLTFLKPNILASPKIASRLVNAPCSFDFRFFSRSSEMKQRMVAIIVKSVGTVQYIWSIGGKCNKGIFSYVLYFWHIYHWCQHAFCWSFVCQGFTHTAVYIRHREGFKEGAIELLNSSSPGIPQVAVGEFDILIRYIDKPIYRQFCKISILIRYCINKNLAYRTPLGSHHTYTYEWGILNSFHSSCSFNSKESAFSGAYTLHPPP